MSVASVVFAAIVRKFSAIVTELRNLVAEAKAASEKIFNAAEVEAEAVIAEAKAKEQTILSMAKVKTKQLENELIEKISKL